MFGVANAQIGINSLWQKELSDSFGVSSMNLRSVAADNSSFLVAGQKSTAQGLSMHAARYSTGGSIQWEKTISADNNSYFSNVIEDTNGDYFLAGSEVLNSNGEKQIHLVKLDKNGQLIWHTKYKGPSGNFASLNDFTLAGGQILICGNEKHDKAYTEAFYARFDLNGKIINHGSFSAGSGSDFLSLILDKDNNIVLAGYAEYGYCFLVAKYKPDGTLDWQYPASFSNNESAYLSDIETDASGNIYAIGTREAGSSFETDIVTMKLNKQGAFQWEKLYHATDEENYGGGIHLGSDGNVYSFGTKEVNFDNYFIALSYTQSGTNNWVKDFTIDKNTSYYGYTNDVSGDYFIRIKDYDSFGIVRLTQSGQISAKHIYGLDKGNQISGCALNSTTLFAVTHKSNPELSFILSLDAVKLTENFNKSVTGQALSDARPGKIVSNGKYLWFANYSDPGDSAYFSITKMDVNGSVLWKRNKKYKSSYPDFKYLDYDKSGNIIGFFQNDVQISTGNSGLIKYDSIGAEIFTIILDSATVYSAGGLAIDENENIYVTGVNNGTRTMFLSKYNPTGNLQWTKYYKSPASFSYSKPFNMLFSKTGKLLLAATHKGANSDNDLHLFQYSTDGTLEWHKDVQNKSGNLVDFSGMHIADNGDITIFGSSSIGSFCSARYDKSGNEKWNYSGLSPSTQAPRSMAVDDNGTSHFCFSSSTGLIVKSVNNNGKLIREKMFSWNTGGNYYFPWTCAVINNQLVILGEHTMPIGATPLQVLLDSQLNEMYVGIDSLYQGKITSLALDNNNKLYAAYFTGDISLGLGQRGTTIRQYEIGKVNAITPISTSENQPKIFPNPTSNQLNILFEKETITGCDVLDLTGKKVLSKRCNNHLEKIDLTPLTPGNYLILVRSESSTYMQNFVRN